MQRNMSWGQVWDLRPCCSSSLAKASGRRSSIMVSFPPLVKRKSFWPQRKLVFQTSQRIAGKAVTAKSTILRSLQILSFLAAKSVFTFLRIALQGISCKKGFAGFKSRIFLQLFKSNLWLHVTVLLSLFLGFETFGRIKCSFLRSRFLFFQLCLEQC